MPTTDTSLNAGSTKLLEAARNLRPLLQAEAAANEALGKLTPAVENALHENGLFGMWLPAVLGGSELTPRQSLEVLEELTYGDASTGWVVMAASLSVGTAGAYLAPAAVETIFPKDRKRLNLIAGQGTRAGTAIKTEGGHLVSGSWSFGSGLKHSAYIHTAAIVQESGEFRIFNPPVEKATLIDNWDVMGLRATGSIDYVLDNVFIPEDFSHPVLTQKAKRGGSLYRLGILNFAAICHSGWALGMGRRLLDELAALMKGKMGRAAQNAANDSLQQGFGLAEAKLRAARALVFETWADVEQTLARDEPLSTRQDTMIRLAMYNVNWTSREVSEFVYKSAGTTALREGPIQRYFRDMHAGIQHITAAPMVIQACGQELAGQAEGKHWVVLSLVDGPG